MPHRCYLQGQGSKGSGVSPGRWDSRTQDMSSPILWKIKKLECFTTACQLEPCAQFLLAAWHSDCHISNGCTEAQQDIRLPVEASRTPCPQSQVALWATLDLSGLTSLESQQRGPDFWANFRCFPVAVS